MAEQIKELIEKIQQEGVEAAQLKAKAIEEEAAKRAGHIYLDATKDAQTLINEAKEKIAKMEEASRSSLKQAGRDLLITLRKEINSMLEKIIILRIQEALTPAELGKIISGLIKDYSKQDKAGIVISLAKEDLQKIEKGLLQDLKEEIEKGVSLKVQDDITAGFLISFDKGKSSFDFSDKALAQRLAEYLKPKLQELLKEIV